MSDTTPGAGPTPEPTPDPTPDATPDAAPASPSYGGAHQPHQPHEPHPAGSTPAGSTPAGSAPAVETLKGADRLDLGIIGAGALAFLGSLLPYYTVSVDAFGSSVSESATAWHGFFGWFGAVLALAGAGLLLARLLGVSLSLPVPVRTLVLGLFAVAALCTVLALFVVPGGSCDEDAFGASVCDLIDQGHGFGYWLALLATLVGTALAAVRRSAD
ncbi:hypothetical protein [Nocardioides renjunii]|uniref:hypothetical protein n=1 Tax=Nocardioides renjunii TaxID=3095075 RepID=UPI002AFFC8A2|nr:hypothetical protein [Nocardioides sp. S-34]WQQ22347.1 hypothetical protein SHK17_20955 [Nocardioides sp. S-34]